MTAADAEVTAVIRGLAYHPMFQYLMSDRYPLRTVDIKVTERPGLGWARVSGDGTILVNQHRKLTAPEWHWVLTHCLLHLGFGHLDPAAGADDPAACLVVTRFQRELKLGDEPVLLPDTLPGTDEEVLRRQWRRDGVPEEFTRCGAGDRGPDLDPSAAAADQQWPERLARGLSTAAVQAVEMAGGGRDDQTSWDRALSWFAGSFPLLGGVAAGFTVVADAALARSWDISVAAVSAQAGEIYINPLRTMSEAEWRFVLAHEMLHVSLRHLDRVGPREPQLWNVACDYVINGWLVEMGVGAMPDGLLHDPALAGASAEDVYDRLVSRRRRKIATLRGPGRGDMLGEPIPWAGHRAGGIDLDEYCRRSLLTGYAYHVQSGRGLLPAGLEQEIRVLEHPPPPWDVRLARWFDEHVRTPDKHRSYARPSRRQSATPHIPRPGRHHLEEEVARCTFGVVVDTSGSMSSQLMGKALGAIASYATARDVPAARVVFCDAAAYDAGYLPVDDIAGRIRVRGRGGTVLQPALDLLERADDFPADGPILVITDGECDVLRFRRPHALLIPSGARLPFTPRGPVFHLR